ALRHVADLALDLVGLLDHVEAEAGAAAVAGRQQPAEHADRRRLAAAVRSEEAVDLALLHAQREVLDDVLFAEVLVQAANVDRGGFRIPERLTATSTGCPGRSRAASADDGRASIR